MIPLYTEEEYNKSKSTDTLLCQCLLCEKPFNVIKKFITYELKNNRNRIIYCSDECYYLSRKTSLLNDKPCSNCGISFERRPSETGKSKSGNLFCSQSCSATFNNKNKTHGNRRSKLEIWLEEQLITLYPKLQIDFNKKNESDVLKNKEEVQKFLIEQKKYKDEIDLLNVKIDKSNCSKTEQKITCSEVKEQIDALKSNLELDNENLLKNIKDVYGSQTYTKERIKDTEKKLLEKEALFNKMNCALEVNFDLDVKSKDFDKCVNLDKRIKKATDEIVAFRQLSLKSPKYDFVNIKNIAYWEDELRKAELEFANLNCRDKISQQRLKDVAVISTLASEKMENTILDPNQQEQYIYIGIGAVVLLTGLYIIAKK
jgi:hypothetical protein